jgi:Fe-S cluster biogenesis protein NfuA
MESTDTTAAEPIEAPAPPDSGLHGQLLETIDAIRPALQADGGDMTLVSVDEATGVVEIELAGACGTCPASTFTLKAGVERILKDRVPGVTEVRALGLEALEGLDDDLY